MSVDFQAFTAGVVLDALGKRVDALEAWGNTILAGLADGSFVLLEPDSRASPGQAAEQQPWQVVQAVKAFAKRQLLQLQARPTPPLANIATSLAHS